MRRKKIRSVMHRGDLLACEVCGFDFEQIYGDRGRAISNATTFGHFTEPVNAKLGSAT